MYNLILVAILGLFTAVSASADAADKLQCSIDKDKPIVQAIEEALEAAPAQVRDVAAVNITACAIKLRPEETGLIIETIISLGIKPEEAFMAAVRAELDKAGENLALLLSPGSPLLPSRFAAPNMFVEQLENAMTAGMTLSEAVVAAVQAQPGKAEMIIKAASELRPDEIGEIVASLLQAGMNLSEVITASVSADLDKAGAAVTAAISLMPEREAEIVQYAILAGADPTIVAAATAAGRAPPSPFAPASMPSVGIGAGGLTPFGVGVVNLTVGSGPASPS